MPEQPRVGTHTFQAESSPGIKYTEHSSILPLPWLVVCEHSLTKIPQHTLLAGAQTCYQKCWGAPARRHVDNKVVGGRK